MILDCSFNGCRADEEQCVASHAVPRAWCRSLRNCPGGCFSTQTGTVYASHLWRPPQTRHAQVAPLAKNTAVVLLARQRKQRSFSIPRSSQMATASWLSLVVGTLFIMMGPWSLAVAHPQGAGACFQGAQQDILDFQSGFVGSASGSPVCRFDFSLPLLPIQLSTADPTSRAPEATRLCCPTPPISLAASIP